MIYDNCFENSNVPCQKLLCKWFGSYRDEVYKEYIHAQLCLTLCNPMRVASVAARLPCPWNFPGKKTGVGCRLLLQIFSTQGPNPLLLRPLHWQTDSLLLSHLGNLYKGSVQFSCSVVSDSLWPHELQQARPPCPSPTPRLYSNSCPSSQWCHPTISSSVVPFSSCPQSLPASRSFPMSQLFSWGGQSVGVVVTF